MKYAVLQCVNGNFSVVSEHGENKEAGIIKWNQTSAALHNAKDVVTARLNLVDENLQVVDGRYTEWIDRRTAPEQED